jgi:hypothetical protein
MASPITFRQSTTQAADAILKSDKAKLQWAKMPIDDLPNDIQALAAEAIQNEIATREAKLRLQAALDDKVEAPTGKRLIVTLGRDVSDSTDSILVAWANASSSGTKTISFADFVGRK